MLDHLGEGDAAARVERAVAAWLASRGSEGAGGLGYSTQQVGDRLAELVADA